MKIICSAFLSLLLFDFAIAQKFPEGYMLQYKQDFNNGKSLSDFDFDHRANWGIFSGNGNYFLQCTSASDSLTKPDLPSNTAILSNKVFGDFILEADVMPVMDSGGFGEICLFLGIKDDSKYYFVQLANHSDSNRHGVYVVKNSLPKKITEDFAEAITWKEKKWHHVRLERDIVKRTITVFLDDMKNPVFHVKDYELVMGMVGVGSFGSPCRFDNISIWSQTVITEE
ncbi:MAG: hypothetical protein JXA72_08510 [Bacteroidales bacterium]|nr:hypothetical protein [Bacteroidales bacterium]